MCKSVKISCGKLDQSQISLLYITVVFLRLFITYNCKYWTFAEMIMDQLFGRQDFFIEIRSIYILPSQKFDFTKRFWIFIDRCLLFVKYYFFIVEEFITMTFLDGHNEAWQILSQLYFLIRNSKMHSSSNAHIIISKNLGKNVRF